MTVATGFLTISLIHVFGLWAPEYPERTHAQGEQLLENLGSKFRVQKSLVSWYNAVSSYRQAWPPMTLLARRN